MRYPTMLKKYWLIIVAVILLVTVFIGGLIYFSPKPAAIAGITSDNVFYQHKTIPVIVEQEIKAALSYYPELEQTPIDFVLDPHTSKSIMLSQPVIASFFKGRRHRAYVVKINPQFATTHNSIPIQKVPKDILIGWFGHELGHIKDYTTRSNAGMALFGLKYVCSDKFLMQAEQNADNYAVDHGLADYIIKTKNFILNNSDIPQEYKARIRRLYPSPQQILDMVKRLKHPEHQH
jgi:hypothetical protein